MEFVLDKIIIEGGNTRLQGEVVIEGAKMLFFHSWLQQFYLRKERQF